MHEETGHHGIKRTLYFSRKLSPAVTRRDVRRGVKPCQVCQSINPAPVKCARWELNVDEIWYRVGMDVTHVNGCHYLTLINCGPTRFAVWRRLQRQYTDSVIKQLEWVFFERGAPVELLTDNDPAFCSCAFTQFAERWALRVRFKPATGRPYVRAFSLSGTMPAFTCDCLRFVFTWRREFDLCVPTYSRIMLAFGNIVSFLSSACSIIASCRR